MNGSKGSSSERTKQLRLPDGQQITYTLKRKRVKNINLRVRPDGTVTVSAPLRVPEREIERVVFEKADFIRDALDRVTRTGLTEDVLDRDLLPLYGQLCPVVTEEGQKEEARYAGSTLRLTLRQRTPESRHRVLLGFLTEECRRTVTPMVQAQLVRFRAVYPEFPMEAVPALRFRWMKTRWGSCQPMRQAVTLNVRLVLYSPACAEYVVVHELAHFLRPDHSAAFYAILDRMLPEWRERKRLLAEGL